MSYEFNSFKVLQNSKSKTTQHVRPKTSKTESELHHDFMDYCFKLAFLDTSRLRP